MIQKFKTVKKIRLLIYVLYSKSLKLDESNVRPILINILLRVRPCFEKDKAPIRASSYNLFGELARFGKGPSRDPFMEQVHSNFVGFVLHLNESDPKVRMACRRVLRQVGPLMDSKEVERMFNEALPENKTSLHYGEFINDLAKILVHKKSHFSLIYQIQ